MNKRDAAKLQKALKVLRGDFGDGKLTKVSHKRMGEQHFTCVQCRKPTVQQDPGVQLPPDTVYCNCP